MIEIVGLSKSYGRVVAVDDLSFTVRPGRVTGFLGPNGAGKSTTMRLVLGLDRPDSGTTRVAGVSYSKLSRPLRIVGSLLEGGTAHPGRSAYHHLLWLAQSNRIGRSRVDEVLRTVGLESVRRRRAGGFSLGMRQRLGLAAALLGDPEILLLDEPGNGLDPEGTRWVRGLLRSLAAEGRTVLVSSHLLSEVAATAEHVVVIGRGRLLEDASVADFLARHTRPVVQVRTPEPERLRQALVVGGSQVEVDPSGILRITGVSTEEVGRVAAGLGVSLDELSRDPASLEEAFVRLTQDSTAYRTGGQQQ